MFMCVCVCVCVCMGWGILSRCALGNVGSSPAALWDNLEMVGVAFREDKKLEHLLENTFYGYHLPPPDSTPPFSPLLEMKGKRAYFISTGLAVS